MVQKGELDDLRASGKFDAEWYLSEYPDVAQLGMDPAEHYLWLGRMLGRSPARVQQNHFTELTEGRESHGFRSNATFVDFERAWISLVACTLSIQRRSSNIAPKFLYWCQLQKSDYILGHGSEIGYRTIIR